MRCRHRLSKLLLRHGVVYSGGRPWNGVHEAWLRGQRFDQRSVQIAFDTELEAMLLVLNRRARLDKAITEMADDGEYTPLVRRLGCLRGVSTLTAFGMAVEIGDWHRFSGEWRVARPAAAGRTNHEIAQDLHVTPKTVETHLSSVYRKLGVRNRTAMARVLAQAEPARRGESGSKVVRRVCPLSGPLGRAAPPYGRLVS